MSLKLYVEKLSKNAKLPVRSTIGAAGYDLSSAANVTIRARERGVVPTDLKICLPDKVYGRIAPRSGLALKQGIDVGAGVIDPDYRGSVGVILFNHSDVDFKIEINDRIAQLILEKIAIAEVEEVESVNETIRGSNGYGSTGIKEKEK